MEQNELSIKFDFNGDRERETRFESYCRGTANEFRLAGKRLYVYVATSDDPEFTHERSLHYRGKYFRGFHAPPEDMHELPQYLRTCVFIPDSELCKAGKSLTFMEMLAIDNLIYIRNSTCSDLLTFVLTLSHELQHVSQYCYLRKILSANSLLNNHLATTIDPATTLTPIDLPHEQDSNVISKRVAQKFFGVEAVGAYAQAQIEHFRGLSMYGESNARAEFIRWQFFDRCDPSVPYDLTAKTMPLFEQYKSKIKPELAKQYGLDITKEQWWT